MTSTETGSSESDRLDLTADALRFVDLFGVDALSPDTLAEALDISVQDVLDALGGGDPIDLVCEAIYAEIDLALSDQPWPQKLRHYARSFREALLRHPGAVPPVATRPIVSESAMAVAERAISEITTAGFDPVEANRVLLVIVSFVLGHTMSEVGVGQALEYRPNVRDFRNSLNEETLPLAAEALRSDPDRDAEFELGLNLLVDGLERRILHS